VVAHDSGSAGLFDGTTPAEESESEYDGDDFGNQRNNEELDSEGALEVLSSTSDEDEDIDVHRYCISVTLLSPASSPGPLPERSLTLTRRRTWCLA